MSTGSDTNSRDRFRFRDEDERNAFDAALRDAATRSDVDSVDACADAAAEALGEADRGRLRIRAFQLGLYEPEWPSHLDREQVEQVASDVETVSEAAEALRISRKRTKKALRWAGVLEDVEQTTSLSLLQKVRSGEIDGTIPATSGGED